MVAYHYDFRIALVKGSPNTVAANATVLVYDHADTGYVTPVTVYSDPALTTIVNLVTDAYGIVPDFWTDNKPDLLWKSGTMTGGWATTSSRPGLRGEKGDTGSTGPMGAQGNPGLNGAGTNAEVATFVSGPGETQTAIDNTVANKVADAASATRVALNSTYAKGVNVAPGANAVANDALLANAAAQAAILGAPLIPKGTFPLTVPLALPAGTRLQGQAATFQQTTALTPPVTIATANVTVEGLTLQGLTTDYVDSGSVYDAAGISLGVGASNVIIRGCRVTGFAGCGVNVHNVITGSLLIADNVFTGPGSAYITTTNHMYGAGVRLISGNGAHVINNDISGFAQGVRATTGLTDLRIAGNRIHDIPGQHGLYLGGQKRATIVDNQIRSTGLDGIKMALDPAGPDAEDNIISGNVITLAGNHGLHIANSGFGSADPARLRRTLIQGNIVTDPASEGIYADSLVDSTISGNTFTLVRRAIRVPGATDGLEIAHNRIKTASIEGILCTGCSRVRITDNDVYDATTFAVFIGAASQDVTVARNQIQAPAGGMTYGVYIDTAAVTATVDVIGNLIRDATQYGIRFAPTTAARRWYGNDSQGTVGSVTNPPASGFGFRNSERFGAAAPTTGTWALGDMVWNAAPAAAGTMGWVCTTAGTPGTWKTFGAIAA